MGNSKGGGDVDGKYIVTVITGDKFGAGTDANVYIQLFGESGETVEMKLDNAKDNFETGKTDIFSLDMPSVGPLKRVVLRHDNSGASSGWFCESVSVRYGSSVIEFFCHRWLAEDEGDGKIQVELWAGGAHGEVDIKKPKGKGGFSFGFGGSGGKSHSESSSPDEKKPKKKKDKKQGFGLNLPDLDFDFNSNGGGDVDGKYIVTVKTGDKFGAGTDANVYIQLFGESGETVEMKLDNAKDNFETGKTDNFSLDMPNVGPLKRVVLRHDNSGASSGWFCESVSVRYGASVTEFFCHR